MELLRLAAKMTKSVATSTIAEKKLPPGPGGLGLGRLRHRLRDGAGFYEHMHREYGDIAYFRLVSRMFCVVFDPDMIGEVLVTKAASFEKALVYKRSGVVTNPTSVTSDGDEHRRIRKLLQPSFGGTALNGYGEIMIEEALQLQSEWRHGDTIDIATQTNQMALNVVGKAIFGTDERIDYAMLRSLRKALLWSMALSMIPLGPLIGRLPLPQNWQRRRALERIDEVVYRVIRKARSDTEERSDLLSFLVNAYDEDGIHEPLSDEEVRDESFILILAGHETTASALSWSFYHLSRNPKACERLEKEVEEVLGGRPPTPVDYRNLPYARAVLDETLRLTPSLYIVGRTAIEDCEIGGYRIPKGTTVQTCWRIPQRSEKYFPEADKFKPERWLEPEPPGRPKHAYTPFGGGARLCIGHGFAKMEVVFTLAAVCQRWRLDVISDEFPEVSSLANYKMKNGLPVRLSARSP